MHRFHLDLVDWNKVKQVSGMVEDRTMDSADLRFGPLQISIYAVRGQGTLRMDFKVDED